MNFADYIFRRLIPGTIITVTMDSGNIIGPAIFTHYNPATSIAVLEEEGTMSPPTNMIINIGSSKVESIMYDVSG